MHPRLLARTVDIPLRLGSLCTLSLDGGLLEIPGSDPISFGIIYYMYLEM